MHELAAEMVALGHQVTLLTSTRDISASVLLETIDGIDVVRVNAGKTLGSGWIARAISELFLSLETWWRARKHVLAANPDLIVFYSPSIFWGWLVQWTKNHFGCPAYLILRDIFPQWAIDLGLIRRFGPSATLFRMFERKQYAVSNTIGVQSPANLDYFGDKPALGRRTEVLWNWIVRSPRSANPSVSRQSLSLEGKCIFCYGGNIGVAQNLSGLIRIAVDLGSDSNAHFLIVGDGSEKRVIEKLVEELKPSNVTILPLLPQQEFDNLLNWIDVGLVILDPKLGTHNIPGKMLNYCAAGKPVIAQVNPGNDLMDLLHQYGAGLSSAGDESAFQLNIKLLAGDADLRTQLGVNGLRMASELFSVRTAAEQILRTAFAK